MLSCRPRADVNYSEIRSASCKSLTAAGLPRFPQRCFQGGMKDVLNRDVQNLQCHRATGPEPPCFPKIRIFHVFFNSSANASLLLWPQEGYFVVLFWVFGRFCLASCFIWMVFIPGAASALFFSHPCNYPQTCFTCVLLACPLQCA